MFFYMSSWCFFFGRMVGFPTIILPWFDNDPTIGRTRIEWPSYHGFKRRQLQTVVNFAKRRRFWRGNNGFEALDAANRSTTSDLSNKIERTVKKSVLNQRFSNHRSTVVAIQISSYHHPTMLKLPSYHRILWNPYNSKSCSNKHALPSMETLFTSCL